MSRLGLSALIPTFGEDVVAISKQSEKGDDEQILTDAHLIGAQIDEHVTFYTHPLENGRSLVDHRIIQPVTIDFTILLVDSVSIFNAIGSDDFFVTAKDVYGQIRELFLAGTILSIQTRTDTYRFQVLQSMPHEETSRMFDGIMLTFSTSEIQFETANVPTPEKLTDTNTAQRGRQNAIEVVGIVATSVLFAAGLALGS
jgi:hypothetical protein